MLGGRCWWCWWKKCKLKTYPINFAIKSVKYICMYKPINRGSYAWILKKKSKIKNIEMLLQLSLALYEKPVTNFFFLFNMYVSKNCENCIHRIEYIWAHFYKAAAVKCLRKKPTATNCHKFYKICIKIFNAT